MRLIAFVVAAALFVALVPAGAGAAVVEFPTGTVPQDAVAGPDGNVWFVETGPNKIGRVTPEGVLTEYPSGPSSLLMLVGAAGIAAGPDGNLWFSENTKNMIGRITPAGAISEFLIAPTATDHRPHGIVAGPDGNLWFTETSASRVGKMTTAGVLLAEYPLAAGRNPYEITAGPDGNLWFTEHTGGGALGRITTSGVVTEFPGTPPGMTVGQPTGITAGPDGNLWFTENADPGAIGRMSPSGVLTEYKAGLTNDRRPVDIVAGNDGSLYFSEHTGSGTIGKVTTAGVISELAGGPSSAPFGVTVGGDGNIWFTEDGADIVGRLAGPGATTTAPAGITPTAATLTATIRPYLQATTSTFDWGTTTAYGASTAAVSAGAGAVPVGVTGALAGLAPATTYHYRAVATNASGTTYGADQSFTTPAAAPILAPAAPVLVAGEKLPPATRPVFGRSATIATLSGSVMVTLPGGSTPLPLDAASTVPVGTTIDATAGTIRLTNVRDRSGKLQTARFWGGSFTLRQARTKKAATVIALTPPTCTKTRQLASRTAPRVRQLWSKDSRGRFVTRGRSAVATVRGTLWLTQETCAGTRVRVGQGVVSVRDLVHHRTVLVHAGQSYLARLR
ncbi:MAG: virginiamycin lyase [Gaiellales bacterium]|nr:virginiamycin lyase [Gaiellales bacterium]